MRSFADYLTYKAYEPPANRHMHNAGHYRKRALQMPDMN